MLEGLHRFVYQMFFLYLQPNVRIKSFMRLTS